ncbi:hypothetical protein [Cupriavidus plantarum]|nr:hypothetical protein [Cupriavidus plantarum]NYH99321.1 hypothetical protein [Cupriavidus plantarum]REF02708.1 hypothetical protein C7418_1528 [Cupriavidus plantarum]RLK44428.1 hypothetical protein C7417_0408 [Cupriavidus plantarum]SMR65640.1 hypothetical protein SAMN05421735_0490 [Cupriavidus plantarum]
MHDHPRFSINRAAVMLVPEQPFLDWILAVDPDPIETLTLEAVREDETVFLVPPEFADDVETTVKWVEARWRSFFELMLGEWFTDALWPKELTLAMFREWFTVRVHSMVWDLAADTPVLHEDWDEDTEDGADDGDDGDEAAEGDGDGPSPRVLH